MRCPKCNGIDFEASMGLINHKNQLCNYTLTRGTFLKGAAPALIEWKKDLYITITGRLVYRHKEYLLESIGNSAQEIDQETLCKLISMVEVFLENFHTIG